MKWIGQHIWSLISRFRSDVYLEDVSTGTIASGGNLGLDSNNKIVKATETVGDITEVRFRGDTGIETTTSGAADFQISGGTGLTTSLISNTLTITLDTPPKSVSSVDALTGVTGTNLGTFTGDTISDSRDIKEALQDLETKTEVVAAAGAKGIVELATTGEADTGTDTARAVTPAGLKSHVDARYAYTYITFSASAVPTNSGSDPEWMFPNPSKGIYEEDWNSDSGITSTVLENSTAIGKNHAANSIPLPHAGVLVGFRAVGRNDDSNLSFKAGLFHSSGAGTGDGIDWGNTSVNHEFTLECTATADTSGGVSGSTNFKGPCKLVSNTVNKTIAAGDTILPAIMATADNATDEIFVTWTIILKIPLTT